MADAASRLLQNRPRKTTWILKEKPEHLGLVPLKKKILWEIDSEQRPVVKSAAGAQSQNWRIRFRPGQEGSQIQGGEETAASVSVPARRIGCRALKAIKKRHMLYEIKVNGTLSIIEVKHEGPVDIDEMCAAREETAQHLTDNKFKRVFVDIRNATLNPTTMELFGFNASYHDLLPLGVRIAIVYSSESANREDILFVETVARNRRTLLKIFTDRDEALDWLKPVEGATGS